MIDYVAGQAAAHSGGGDPFFVATVCYVMAVSLAMVIRPQIFRRLNRRRERAATARTAQPSPRTFQAYRIAGAIGLAAATSALVVHLMRG